MINYQAGIMDEVPAYSCYLGFSLKAGHRTDKTLLELCKEVDGNATVLGLGLSLVHALGSEIAGLKDFPTHSGPGFDIPSTPRALWLWLRGEDPGEIYLRSQKLQHLLQPTFELATAVNAFRYVSGRDLTGYEDGTENPAGTEAIDAAIVKDGGNGMPGSSFVAVQQWLHDLPAFNSMEEKERDNTIGRRITDNEEIDDAPESAHVKRTAQEDFSPEAFILRRSMPWDDTRNAGLVFVAFGKSYYAFEALLNRMTGSEDGITDALYRFTRPLDGSYYWCPPMKNGKPDLSALSL